MTLQLDYSDRFAWFLCDATKKRIGPAFCYNWLILSSLKLSSVLLVRSVGSRRELLFESLALGNLTAALAGQPRRVFV
jgi:hypothetical protein